jgi:hypothetical protein
MIFCNQEIRLRAKERRQRPTMEKNRDKSFIFDNGDDTGIDYTELYENEEDGIDYDTEEDFEYPYEDIYDLDGDEVICPICGGTIQLKDGKIYICPSCEHTMTREEFLAYIGVDPSEDDYNDYYRYP